MSSISPEVRISLLPKVTCPHCWHAFHPEDCLWIADDPHLIDDPRLGPEHQLRFLPSRFDVQGRALDAKNRPCEEIACPHCHLRIPRPMLELRPLFASIMGSPACGKSYFLASMAWGLRRLLPQAFNLSFGDADPISNRVLNDYEELQFFNREENAVVKLPKTEEQGDLYDEVRFGDQVVRLPNPFLFSVRPLEQHPRHGDAKKVSQLLCLYDNAGESFQPGKDTSVNPVTRHLARSQLLLFLFDPTQDPRFREACQHHSHDAQVTQGLVTSRQETVLHEAASRVRRHARLGQNERHKRPLIVVVTKCDVWKDLLRDEELQNPWRSTGKATCLDTVKVELVSRQLRHLLWTHSPEIVSAAEAFATNVLYVPVSATGCSPERDEQSGALGFRPKDLTPTWCEVPLLYALAMWTRGLVPRVKYP